MAACQGVKLGVCVGVCEGVPVGVGLPVSVAVEVGSAEGVEGREKDKVGAGELLMESEGLAVLEALRELLWHMLAVTLCVLLWVALTQAVELPVVLPEAQADTVKVGEAVRVEEVVVERVGERLPEVDPQLLAEGETVCVAEAQ